MNNSHTLLIAFLFSTLVTLSFQVSAEDQRKCSDYHDGAIICNGDVFFQSNLMGEKQASCFSNPQLAQQIQIALNSVQRDQIRDSNGDFFCDAYHDNTLICADGEVYLSQLSDNDLMNCHQIGNRSRSMKEAVNQALMEAAIDEAVRQAAQR